MRHFFSKGRGGVPWPPNGRWAGNIVSPVIAFSLFAGILLGSIFGLFSESISAWLSTLPFLAESPVFGGLPAALWQTCRYLLCALLLSASLLGVLLLPCLAFARGFLLACAVAACFAARRYLGLADAALCIGIPALLELPLFLTVAGSGIRFSLRLLSATGVDFRRSLPAFSWKERFLLLLPLLLLAILYRQMLLPILVNRLLS